MKNGIRFGIGASIFSMKDISITIPDKSGITANHRERNMDGIEKLKRIESKVIAMRIQRFQNY